MSISTPRLIRSRHGTYYFRLLVPPAARAAVGKREFRTSLGTKDPADARVRALRLSIIFEHSKRYVGSGAQMKHLLDQLAQHAREFTIRKGDVTVTINDDADLALYEKAVAAGLAPPLGQAFDTGATGAQDHRPSALEGTGLVPSSSSALQWAQLQDLLSSWRAKMEKRRDLALKTINGRVSTAGCLIEYLSTHDPEQKNRPWYAHEVKPRHIQRFLDWYIDRSLRPSKKGGRPRRNDPEEGGLAAATRMAQLGNLKHFFLFCASVEAIEASAQPVRDDLLEETKRAQRSVTTGEERYLPFTRDEIQSMFDPVRYLKATTGDAEFFWSPLLAAFTGARQGEIAQLTLGKIRNEDGVAFILIDDRVKTENSRRRVPISDTLVDLGFLNYVDHVRKLALDVLRIEPQKVPLLPLFPMQTRGRTFETNPGKRVSAFFARYLDNEELGIREEEKHRKVFHSFRHTFVSILDALDVPFLQSQLLVGHAAQDGLARRDIGRQFTSVTHRYTHHDVEGLHKEKMLSRLKAHLRDIDFDLKTSHLRAAADIVLEKLVPNRKGGPWKSGWHTNATGLTEEMVARLQVAIAEAQDVRSTALGGSS